MILTQLSGRINRVCNKSECLWKRNCFVDNNQFLTYNENQHKHCKESYKNMLKQYEEYLCMTNGEMLAIMNAISDIKEEISGLRVEMRDGYRELKEDVLELRADVQVLKEDVQVLKEDVQVLKEDVQNLKEGVRDLNEKFEELNAFNQHCIMPALRDHATGITRLNMNHRELSARMDAVEGRQQAAG